MQDIYDEDALAKAEAAVQGEGVAPLTERSGWMYPEWMVHYDGLFPTHALYYSETHARNVLRRKRNQGYHVSLWHIDEDATISEVTE